MIPVLIVPILNRWDLAERLLASLDVPVERVVVVDNGCSGRTLAGATHYIRPMLNLGFAGGINAAISQTPEAAWWMWAGIDVTFGAGDLTNIEHLLRPGPCLVTGDRNDERLLRFAYAALNRECIEAVGLLDEWTFYPAYYDDDDYEYRCRQGGVEWIEFNGGISHERSATIRSNPLLDRENSRTFPLNRDRYVAKWGGPPGAESFSRPWNKPVPLSYTPADIAGRARRIWTSPSSTTSGSDAR
jgi:GT2 family glycosyltransferase